MALDPCPYCGKDFDHNNAGARTQHINSCKEEAEKYQQDTQQAQAAQPAQQPREQPAEAVPARQEDQPQQSQAPAMPTETEALQTGEVIGSTLVGAMGGSPEEKAETTETVSKMLGSAIASMGTSAAQQQKEGANRARNAEQGSLEKVEDYVDCPDCGTQITNLPEPGTEFGCPGCGVQLRYGG
jgi:hypothetical protein